MSKAPKKLEMKVEKAKPKAKAAELSEKELDKVAGGVEAPPTRTIRIPIK
jgi:bacteriocin-like protein